MNIQCVGAGFLQADGRLDGRTDMKFCERP